ncbi:cytochrome P450 [Roridomyces roridus]|uniref:Cytochrome P450 n=1 Tax=Roridomyces roridus TaxID=1738132 RepID=A0AAD7BIL4_9AGAR|nr:cytochrome P450 [Roridomyces roridus]
MPLPTIIKEPSLWLTVSTICFVWLLRKGTRRSGSKAPLPPGPSKLPLIGNVLDIRGRRMWEACMEWSRKYDSDVIHLSMAGTSVVVLSSLEAMEALLENRASIYSDRPTIPILELMEWDFLIPTLRYGDEWRTQRRLMNQHVNVSASKAFKPQITQAARALLRRLLDAPDDFPAHIRVMAGEVIIPLAYGLPVVSTNDPYIALAEKAVKHGAQAAAAGTYLVNFLPILKHVPAWMPGAGFQRVAQRGREYSHAMRTVAFEESKRRMGSGELLPCFTANALEAIDTADFAYDENTVRDVAAVMYAGGSDTTVAALATFFLAMLSNPDAQEKAQREIDAVVGPGRLPEFSSQEALPYVTALVREVLRWKPVAPFAMPHFIGVEDEYSGYRIPAKSFVFPNVWAVLHDENVYPDPYTFRPERFLTEDGKLDPTIPDPTEVAFGLGRRSCPGRHLAELSIWIAVVSVLAVFDIKKKVGENGEVVEPSYEYTVGVISEPEPFECSIKPRSEATARLV